MRIDRKFRNKVTSIIISAALLTNSVPFAAISEYIPHWSEKSAVAVDVVAADYSPSVQIEEFNQNSFSFNDTNTNNHITMKFTGLTDDSEYWKAISKLFQKT